MEILSNRQKPNWRAIWWEPNFWVEHQHWSRRVARTVWKNWDSGSCVNQELVWVKRIIQKFKFSKSLSLTSFLNGNRVTLVSLISPTGVIPTPAEPALLTYSGAEECLEDLRKDMPAQDHVEELQGIKAYASSNWSDKTWTGRLCPGMVRSE